MPDALSQSGLQRSTDIARIVDHAFGFERVDHGKSHFALQRASGEGVEIARLCAKAFNQIAPRGGGRQWQARPHRFAGNDDVRDQAYRVITPPLAGAPISSLNLVGDDQAACGLHDLGGFGHKSFGNVRQTFIGKDRAQGERRKARAFGLQLVNRRAQAGDISVSQRCTGKTGLHGAVSFGERNCTQAKVALVILAQIGQRTNHGVVAVIGVICADDPAHAGGDLGHAQRHFDSLGTAAAFGHPLQPGQPLGKGNRAFVQIPAVRVQRSLLPRHRLDNARVRMADAGDIVVHIDIAPPGRVKQVCPLAPHQMQRLFVE